MDSSFPIDDSPVKRPYKFNCLDEACTQSDFARKSGDGSTYHSTLDEIAPGVYEGTEVDDVAGCPADAGEGSRTTDHHVEITKAKHGKAKKLSGTGFYEWTQCGPGDDETGPGVAARPAVSDLAWS